MVFSFVRILGQLAAARLVGEIDVLHIQVAGGGSAYRKSALAIFARALSIPYIMHIHGSRFHETWPKRRPGIRWFIDFALTGSAEILVLGRFWADFIANNLPAVANKIRVLPNATPSVARSQVQMPRSEEINITCLGLLGERKGTSVLLEALNKIDIQQSWKATIAGNGEVAKYQAESERLGIANRVSFPGWISGEDVEKLLASTDIYVLPSFAENLPMSILEAFAHGVPVIATPVGAVPEVVEDGVNGLIVPAGDAILLSNAIGRLVEAPDLRAKMGALAREKHARAFDIRPYVFRLSEIWRVAAGYH